MSDKMRVLLVGCGGISGSWLEACRKMDDVEVVALVDIDGNRAKEKAEEFDLSHVITSTDLEEALDARKPDVVFDCTVPQAHAAVALAALKRGCHVLSEKPMADSMDNAHKMIAAAESAGRLLAVMQNRRYDERIQQLRKFLDSHRIGDVTTVNSDFYLGAHFGGFRAHMDHVLLIEMAIHTFDAARLITGADPLRVYCHDWEPKNSWFKNGPAAVAIFEMTGGVLYDYRGNWVAEGFNTTWESDWRIIGENGTVIWDGGDKMKAQVPKEGSTLVRDYEEVSIPKHDAEKMAGGHYGLIRDFIDCVKSGETPETICTDNIKSLAMVFSAIESAKLGRPVEVNI